MLQSSAIDVLAQSSATVSVYHTMAELWVKTSTAELWSMMIINGRTLKHDDTYQNLPWSVSDHLGFWLVIDVSAVQNPFERHFLIKLTVSDYFFPKIIHIKGLKAEKGLLVIGKWSHFS